MVKWLPMSEQQTYIFHVNGMHCHACVLLIEEDLKEVPYITLAKSNLHKHSLQVAGYFGDMGEGEVAESLTKFIQKNGYTLSVEKLAHSKSWSDFKIAGPIALGFAVLFVLLQKLGIVNLINASEINYGTIFLIGVIASLSTCMAVVGGLLLSMSATFAKEGDKVKPQLMFHIGRIVSFFILGGVIGVIGSAFTLNAGTTFAMNLVIGLVMLVLGINLLEVFPWAKRLQPSMPKFIARHAHGISKINHTLTPLLVGIATFFLPCGFTQSMQLYALTMGGFLSGGLTMLTFALGTLPVLALVSFSSFSMKNSSKSGIFFKTAGLIIIMFALLNLAYSLVVIGAIPPIFNF